MIDLDATIANVRRVEPHMPKPQFDGMLMHLSKHHLSPVQVGELAVRAGVKRVVVTHLAPGATDKTVIQNYLRDIQKNFK